MAGAGAGAGAESSLLKPQASNRESDLGITEGFKTSKPAPRDTLLPPRPYIPLLPPQTVPPTETMGDISLKPPH